MMLARTRLETRRQVLSRRFTQVMTRIQPPLSPNPAYARQTPPLGALGDREAL